MSLKIFHTYKKFVKHDYLLLILFCKFNLLLFIMSIVRKENILVTPVKIILRRSNNSVKKEILIETMLWENEKNSFNIWIEYTFNPLIILHQVLI